MASTDDTRNDRHDTDPAPPRRGPPLGLALAVEHLPRVEAARLLIPELEQALDDVARELRHHRGFDIDDVSLTHVEGDLLHATVDAVTEHAEARTPLAERRQAAIHAAVHALYLAVVLDERGAR